MPNDTTMESTSFAFIEDRITPVIWDVHKKNLEENLSDEVKASVDTNLWRLWQLEKQGKQQAEQ